LPPSSTLFPYTTLFRSWSRPTYSSPLGGGGHVGRSVGRAPFFLNPTPSDSRLGRTPTRVGNLPIPRRHPRRPPSGDRIKAAPGPDRKSTRLNSSHVKIS